MEHTNELQQIQDGLRSIVVGRLNLTIDPASIRGDAPLFGAAAGGPDGGLALDSIEALEIVVGIEEKWGVAIQDDSVASEFYSLDTLAALVSRLLNPHASQEVAGV
jgi:acyl carrier protein